MTGRQMAGRQMGGRFVAWTRIVASMVMAGWLAVAGVAVAAEAPPVRLALVIANGNYAQFDPLAVTGRDGDSVAAALTSTGFVDAAGSGRVLVRRDLALTQMVEAVRQFRDQLTAAGPTAFGVVYFSGHGAALSSFGDLVLLPVDAQAQLAPDNARLTRAALVRDLLGSGARNVLIILDMCRNVIPAPTAFGAEAAIVGDPADRADAQAAQTVGGIVGSKGLRRVIRQSAATLRADQGYLVAFSTSPDQVAFDNGTFSRILAEEIRRPQQNVADALKRTSDRVAVAGLKDGKALQKPTFDYGLQGAPPCFVSCDANSQDRFFDCANCPYMKVVPAGVGVVGSPVGEPSRDRDEPEQHAVRIDKPVAVGVFEVTISEWAACVRDRACRATGDWSRENPNPLLPATGLSFDDAQAYVAWLSVQSGLPYRLPSDAEWEYAARAGGSATFPWGDSITPSDANYDQTTSYRGSPQAPYRGYPEAVAAYPPNAFGLYQMAGNAREWTAGCIDPQCRGRSLRGGSFQSTPEELRVANRLAVRDGKRRDDAGVRVVRDLSADEVIR